MLNEAPPVHGGEIHVNDLELQEQIEGGLRLLPERERLREVIAGAGRDDAERHAFECAGDQGHGANGCVERAVAAGDEQQVASVERRTRGSPLDIGLAGGQRDVEIGHDRAKAFVDDRQEQGRAVRTGGGVRDQTAAHVTSTCRSVRARG
jgi:hypothetical protein